MRKRFQSLNASFNFWYLCDTKLLHSPGVTFSLADIWPLVAVNSLTTRFVLQFPRGNQLIRLSTLLCKAGSPP